MGQERARDTEAHSDGLPKSGLEYDRARPDGNHAECEHEQRIRY